MPVYRVTERSVYLVAAADEDAAIEQAKHGSVMDCLIDEEWTAEVDLIESRMP